MRSLGLAQVVLLLVFVVVPILNLFVRWLQRRLREPGPHAAEIEPREAPPPGRMPHVRPIEPPARREGSRAPALSPEPAPPSAPGFRRTGALGGLPAVRRAIVMMTVLGPCRGLEDGRPPSPPGRGT